MFNLFHRHKWYWKERRTGFRPQECSGDYLPDYVTVYKCKCKTEKRVFTQACTHLGYEPKEIYYVKI